MTRENDHDNKIIKAATHHVKIRIAAHTQKNFTTSVLDFGSAAEETRYEGETERAGKSARQKDVSSSSRLRRAAKKNREKIEEGYSLLWTHCSACRSATCRKCSEPPVLPSAARVKLRSRYVNAMLTNVVSLQHCHVRTMVKLRSRHVRAMLT